MGHKKIFERYEKKYRVDAQVRQELMARLGGRFEPDQYGKSRICNIYFDTPDYRLIRQSIEKPVYKEKLRLRAYGIPQPDTTVFVELKKKYRGVVYKRRIPMPYQAAVRYLYDKKAPGEATQLTREVDWFMDFYETLAPAMFIAYERAAYVCVHDPDLRLTFDGDILYRQSQQELSRGIWGNRLLGRDQMIMELKFKGAVPVWLSAQLDALGIYPASFSKYGEIYKTLLHGDRDTLMGAIICA